MLRERLRRPGRVLRLLDLQAPRGPLGEDEESVVGTVTDAELMARACRGVDAVVHLGGLSREDTWDRILQVNIDGTHTVLEAAHQAGVPTVVLASSNHVVGFRRLTEAGDAGIPADSPPRPDSFYGVSKAAMEALGSLYHSQYGMDVTVLRIGSCFPDPAALSARELATWLSPDDAARLVEACLMPRPPGYRVVWGVSANTRRVYSLTEAQELGYQPQDDAEEFATEVADSDLSAAAREFVGGDYCSNPLGRHNPI